MHSSAVQKMLPWDKQKLDESDNNNFEVVWCWVQVWIFLSGGKDPSSVSCRWGHTLCPEGGSGKTSFWKVFKGFSKSGEDVNTNVQPACHPSVSAWRNLCASISGCQCLLHWTISIFQVTQRSLVTRTPLQTPKSTVRTPDMSSCFMSVL